MYKTIQIIFIIMFASMQTMAETKNSPVLNIPTNNSMVDYTSSIVFNWDNNNNVSTISKIHFGLAELDNNGTPSNFIGSCGNGNALSSIVSTYNSSNCSENLKPNTSYQWVIALLFNDDSKPVSTFAIFTTGADTKNLPKLISPKNEIDYSSSVEFNWDNNNPTNTISKVFFVLAEIDSSDTFIRFVGSCDSENILSSEVNSYSSSKCGEDLKPDTRYKWSIVLVFNDGSKKNGTAEVFTTGAESKNLPQLINPNNEINYSSNIEFNWNNNNPTNTISTIGFSLAEVDTTDTIIQFVGNCDVHNSISSEVNSYSSSNCGEELKPNTIYKWAIALLFNDGSKSVSAFTIFTTGTESKNLPKLINPNNEIDYSSSVEFNWDNNNPTNTISQVIFILTEIDSNDTVIRLVGSCDKTNILSSEVNSYSLSECGEDLKPDTRYKWSIVLTFNDGSEGNGAAEVFTTGADTEIELISEPVISTVTSVSPLNSQIGNRMIFTVTGNYLTDDMGFTVGDCTPSSHEIRGATDNPATERQFECVQLGEPGLKHGLVKDQPGGEVLYKFNVQAAVSEEFKANTTILDENFNLFIPHLIYTDAKNVQHHFQVNASLLPSTDGSLRFEVTEPQVVDPKIASAEIVRVDSQLRVLLPRLVYRTDGGENAFWAIMQLVAEDGKLILVVDRYDTIKSATGTFDLMEIVSQHSGVVGPEGGVVSDEWGDVAVQVPENTTMEDTIITITKGIDRDGNPSVEVAMNKDMGEIAITIPSTEILSSSIKSDIIGSNVRKKNSIRNTRNTKLCEQIEPDHEYPLVFKGCGFDNGWYLKKARFYKPSGYSSGGKYLNYLDFGSRLPDDLTTLYTSYRGHDKEYSIENYPLVTKGQLLNKKTIITPRTAALIVSSCSYTDTNCYKDKTPVLLVHGFLAQAAGYGDSSYGGGAGTWRHFPELIQEMGYVPFEFRWATSARFEDVATDLGFAIKQITEKTGKRIHIIAHSFGGILVRTYLQGLSHIPYQSSLIDSVTTVGSPHSGIFDNEEIVLDSSQNIFARFDNGQDGDNAFLHFSGTTQINLCRQITCFEMGEDVFSFEDSFLKNFHLKNTDRGILIAKLSDFDLNPIKEESYILPIQVLIGLTGDRKTMGKKLIDSGDGLIHYEGQRLLPKLGKGYDITSANHDLLKNTIFGNTIISEYILGFERVSSDTIYPGITNPFSTGDDDYTGYKHTDALIAGNSKPMVAPECDNISNCSHDTIKYVKEFLAKHTGQANDIDPAIALNQKFPISVKIVDETGNPVFGVNVKVFVKSPVVHSTINLGIFISGIDGMISTDANIEFLANSFYGIDISTANIAPSFNLSSGLDLGKYNIDIREKGFFPLNKSGLIATTSTASNSSGDFGTIKLSTYQSPGSLQITAKNNSGSIISAKYELEKNGKMFAFRSTELSTDGLPVGDYSLLVYAENYSSWKGTVTIKTGENQKVVTLDTEINNFSPIITLLENMTTSSSKDWNLSGRFNISDPDGDKVTRLRVHFSKNTAYNERCYTQEVWPLDVTVAKAESYWDKVNDGKKSFSMPNTLQCNSILKESGTIHYKVEARDINGNKAKVKTGEFEYKPNLPPILIPGSMELSSETVKGAFIVKDPEGDKLTKLRVHFSDNDDYNTDSSCYTEQIDGDDYTAEVDSGRKLFSMPTNTECKRLIQHLEDEDDGAILYKIEARDIYGHKSKTQSKMFKP